jgi:hypothetical protein
MYMYKNRIYKVFLLADIPIQLVIHIVTICEKSHIMGNISHKCRIWEHFRYHYDEALV